MEEIKKRQHTTKCIRHKGFSGLRRSEKVFNLGVTGYRYGFESLTAYTLLRWQQF